MEAKGRNRPFRICVFTSTRADYGILRPLLLALSEDGDLDLRLMVTGAHLSEAFGMTVREIEEDGFPIDIRVPILRENTRSMSREFAQAVEEFGVYFQQSPPELLVVLGDRYEAFAVCAAATCTCVPIAHLHGGETTEGAMDECFRHCITKMSCLHFAAAEAYRKRIIQLGEDPSRVFNVGGLGVENALHTDFLLPEELESRLHFPLFQKPYVVTTFHPVTLEPASEKAQLEELLAAVSGREDLHFLITKSNADTGGQGINKRLEQFAAEHANCRVVASLGMRGYMSALKYALCVLGNSSSGLAEAPSFGIPTINIGNRQRGRIQAESVLNCRPEREDILRALERACSPDFRRKAAAAKNPYGDGNTSERICKIIKSVLSSGQIDLKKRFYDIDL
ncbi:MAG: UDP-N-acetylglucosamine 2-epimerase (hydrolyzing) [Oscillibacter sp.]|jgi:GDP/UDP-N,N'-diacetylbacillosamine 2-epimerase (hydrolysing)|nr:UDP-N-acetylglucosamine 2-epimerase (hydrolyzing) [Oscillibacter sp.]